MPWHSALTKASKYECVQTAGLCDFDPAMGQGPTWSGDPPYPSQAFPRGPPKPSSSRRQLLHTHSPAQQPSSESTHFPAPLPAPTLATLLPGGTFLRTLRCQACGFTSAFSTILKSKQMPSHYHHLHRPSPASALHSQSIQTMSVPQVPCRVWPCDASRSLLLIFLCTVSVTMT